ncbi:MAG TPA: zinc ribbon domain-containing protein [Acidobacteriota bacterium]|nr:zinc ribbon domain-containing protein [Acidobacteriota bacterium]
MNCIHCGQPLNPGARFCIACGREQVDRTHPKPPEAPPAQLPPSPSPAQQQYPSPVGSIPHAKVPSKGGSVKVLVALAAAILLLFGIGGVAAYFYFFPPGVYVQDSFKKPHPQIEKQIQSISSRVRYADNTLQITPFEKSFYALLYDPVSSDNATVEGKVEWKQGDQDVMFGIVCCAVSQNSFQVFLLDGKGNYLVQQYSNGTWIDITGFLKLPKAIDIRRNVPYKLSLKTEDDLVSAYLDDKLLIQFLDATDHKGKVGIYAQGGTSGQTTIAFHEFKAKKNSMFQSD